jgi:putative membrane protein
VAKPIIYSEMADEKEFHAVPTESHAREFLASERTFLAWVRTSIAVIGFGFAIMKFDAWLTRISLGQELASTRPVPVGELMIILGAFLSAIGAWHYRRTNRQIIEGKVVVTNWLIFLVAGLVIALSITVLVFFGFRMNF